MRVRSPFLSLIHLDRTYSLLSAKNVRMLLDFFRELDTHEKQELNDIQFWMFMRHITDLSDERIYRVFDMLDVDGSGQIDFDEFYLLLCILISVKDNDEKQFIYRHSRTVFDLLDVDGSGTISAQEFKNFGFIFNLEGKAVKKIFKEFDVSGDQELDYREFRMFAMACIDKQHELQEQARLKMQKKMKKKAEKLRLKEEKQRQKNMAKETKEKKKEEQKRLKEAKNAKKLEQKRFKEEKSQADKLPKDGQDDNKIPEYITFHSNSEKRHYAPHETTVSDYEINPKSPLDKPIRKEDGYKSLESSQVDMFSTKT